MTATRVLETVLYAHDLGAAEDFYTRVLGLPIVSRVTDLLVALRCGKGVLLIFHPEAAAAAGREVPAHGAAGPGHMAFAATAEELSSWRRRLADRGAEIEAEVTWPGGGRSIYIRDPAGNSIEFAPPDLWWPTAG